jgi:hypothetical protein
MKNKELPPDWENVIVVYDKVVERSYESSRIERREKMGFYSKLFGTFSVPRSWQEFKGVLLPYDWGGDHLAPSKIIEWKPLNNEQ